MFYVYFYIDPRTDVPFYIGKGHGNRALVWHTNKQVEGRIRILKEQELKPIIEFIHCNDEGAALWLERVGIAGFGRKDQRKGPLLNHTDGGEGVSGNASVKRFMRINNPTKDPSIAALKRSIIIATFIPTGKSIEVINRQQFADEQNIPYTSIGWAIQHSKTLRCGWQFKYIKKRKLGC